MKFARAGIFTKIVLLVLLLYAVTSLVVLRARIEDEKNTNLQLQQQEADIIAESQEMQYAIDHSGDDEVIGDIARDKLGLVEKDEEVYYAG